MVGDLSCWAIFEDLRFYDSMFESATEVWNSLRVKELFVKLLDWGSSYSSKHSIIWMINWMLKFIMFWVGPSSSFNLNFYFFIALWAIFSAKLWSILILLKSFLNFNPFLSNFEEYCCIVESCSRKESFILFRFKISVDKLELSR